MDYALAKGLQSGFGLLGESVLQDRKRELDDQSEERKAKMKAKLEMDLMKAKYSFMKENPQYKHFATNLSGDIIGFDQYGSPKVMYTAPPEEKQIRLGKANAEIGYKEALGSAAGAREQTAEAMLGVIPSTIAKNNAEAAAAEHRARAPYATPKAAKDPMTITPAQKEKVIQSLMPKDVLSTQQPGDKEYDSFREIAEKKFSAMGYKDAASAAAPNLGVFASGVPGFQPANTAALVAPGQIPDDGSVSDDETDEAPDDEDEESSGLLN